MVDDKRLSTVFFLKVWLELFVDVSVFIGREIADR